MSITSMLALYISRPNIFFMRFRISGMVSPSISAVHRRFYSATVELEER
jgi:hypothetical protein